MSRKVKLKDLGVIVTGNTPKTIDYENFRKNDICFFKPSDITNGSINDLSNSEYYISEYARKKSRILPKGSVLVTCIGIIGKVGILTTEAACNQQINGIIPDAKKVINRYLAYNLLSMRKGMQDSANAAVVPIMNKSQFSDLEIDLRPIEDQKQIADTLDKVNQLIDLRKQQIKKLDLLVKSQFIEMFGDPLRNLKGWTVRKLKDITTTIQSGNTPKGGKQVYVDSGIMFFRSQNVWRNRIELDDIAYINEKTHKKMRQTSIKNKDILITKTGRFNTENSSLGRAALFLGADGSANINGHVYLVRLKEDVVQEFVLYILVMDEYRDYIRKTCVGGIDKRQINKEHLEEFPIITPPCELQNHFAVFVHQVDKSRNAIRKSLEKLESLKKALMQQYFG